MNFDLVVAGPVVVFTVNERKGGVGQGVGEGAGVLRLDDGIVGGGEDLDGTFVMGKGFGVVPFVG